MEKCECPEAGFCQRYQCTFSHRTWQCCQGVSGLTREQEIALVEFWAERRKKPEKEEPFWMKPLNFASALIEHIAAGRPMVNHDQYNERLNICDACPACKKTENGWSCSECGCNLKDNSMMPSKVRWATEQCPKGLWPKIPVPTIGLGCGGCQRKV